jgi:hypothetical protein
VVAETAVREYLNSLVDAWRLGVEQVRGRGSGTANVYMAAEVPPW